MNELIWPLRALLFIPAHKLDWLSEVPRHAPDAVVLDLEEAVPPARKVEARVHAATGIAMLKKMGIPAFVRINPFKQGGADDVLAVALDGLAGVMLPKVESAAEVIELDVALAFAEGRNGLALRTLGIIPIPETSAGLRSVYDIARASRRVSGAVGLVSGPVSGDFAHAGGFKPTPEGFEQIYFASRTIIDCRAAGALYPLAAMLGTRLDDLEAIRVLAERARAFGFTGAAVLHPSHVAVVREVFSPSAAEIRDSIGLLAAMRHAESAGDGAVSYGDRMVDYAMVERAREVLQQAQRYGLPTEGVEV